MDILYEMACALGVTLTREEAHSRFRGISMANIASWIGAQITAKPEDFETEFTKQYRVKITQRFKESLRPMPGAYELLSYLTIPFGVERAALQRFS